MSDVQFYTETTIGPHPAHPGVDHVVVRLFESIGGGQVLSDGIRMLAVPIINGDEAGARAVAATELRKRLPAWTSPAWGPTGERPDPRGSA